MIEKFFNGENLTLNSADRVNYQFGSMQLKIPSLNPRNIISQINDANQLYYFGCFDEKIELEIKSHEFSNVLMKFSEGYVYSSLLKEERDEGVYFLKLRDHSNKEWEFKILGEYLIGVKANFEFNFVTEAV